jgi:outer membrane lipoprotein-sorting protein
MRNTNMLATAALLLLTAFRPPTTGRDIVKKMHDRYAGKWYRSFTFNQTTEFYRNDSLRGSQTWYEAIRFPDRFRMDFGEADSGNAAIFRGDSSYRFRNGQLRSATINNNEGLIFLLGGMYFHPLDQTVKMLGDLHYNLDKFHEDTWKGKPVFVIGADKGEEGVNQLWVDQKELYLVRMLKYDGARKEEALFDDYKSFNGNWTETQCIFYLDGKLVQKEIYHDCQFNKPLEDRLFDPAAFIKRQ